jgi:branched-subunit amino acid transport protein
MILLAQNATQEFRLVPEPLTTPDEVWLPPVFHRFLNEAPLCVMTRMTLENLFCPQRLDTLFRGTALFQYERELLFSQVAELMMSVVLRVHPTVHAAFKTRQATLPVSDQAIYDKLRHMELGVSAALVADSAKQLVPALDAMNARLPDWLPGYRARVLDGAHLAATEKRLKPLRQTWAAPLPGTALAIYDQSLDLVTDVVLTPDGHAQERSLLDEVLQLVKPQDLWIADRNFCTFKFMFGITAAKAAFVIRQHGTVKGKLIGQRRYRGRTDTGKVYEQAIEFCFEGQTQLFRRVTVVLDKPTSDGDTEIHVVTNLPKKVRATKVAELYRNRWTIEGRFYEVTQTLNCEPNTLAYPKAALFAFCLALVASNGVALLKASLRAVHDAEEVKEMSSYYMALEIQGSYVGMMIALAPSEWAVFSNLTAPELAQVLLQVAKYVQPKKYRKAHRGPKKPRLPHDKYQNGGHTSTHKKLTE